MTEAHFVTNLVLCLSVHVDLLLYYPNACFFAEIYVYKSVRLTHLFSCSGDLPPFLRGIIEGVTLHMRWCDGMLLSNNPVVRDNVRENILRQKANLSQQTKLVNEQIYLYRVC